MRKLHYNQVKKVFLFVCSYIFLIPACNTEIEDPANVSDTTIELSAKSDDLKATDDTVALEMLALSEDYKVPVVEAQQQALEAAQEFRA